jgi:type VI secretion system protein ImpK
MIERRAAPSLLGPRGPAPFKEQRATAADATAARSSLLDLMHEGFYVLFMLKNGSAPPSATVFMDKIGQFLGDFEREAKRLRAEAEDIDAAKYAFCAGIDEIILASPFPARLEWERRPLQLLVFGDQLAGEHFFDRLEQLRGRGGERRQALEVFHLCLLLGFQGKYAMDGSEKLHYLTARLGDEIAHMKGRSRGFAPRAARPDQIVNKRRSDIPAWALSAVFGLIAVSAYLGLISSLNASTAAALAPYADLVKLAPRPANLTITFP